MPESRSSFMNNADPSTSVFPVDSERVRTEVSFLDMFLSLSTALDLVNPRLGDHHKLTCCIAAAIGRSVGLEEDSYNRLFSAALVHDIGAASMVDRLSLLEFEETNPHDHAIMGAILLDMINLLRDQAPVVRHHHVRWDDGQGEAFDGLEVSPLSHIVHLADRVAVQIDHNMPILSKSNVIRDKIAAKRRSAFHPRHVEAFLDLSHHHSFWLQLDESFLMETVTSASHLQAVQMDISELMQLSRVYAFIIDSRSTFTSSHSSGVAAIAEWLALASGLGLAAAQKLKIAGFLHDIGKLAIPAEILEKRGRLTDEERLIVKGHSFYTQKVLQQVRGIEEIATWAAQHHETLDGSGYPYGLTAKDQDTESRILSIADIYTALTESRPYRDGMSHEKALEILEQMAEEGQIDQTIFGVLCDSGKVVNAYRAAAQDAENAELWEFWGKVRESFKLNH